MYFASVTCAKIFTPITFEIQVCFCRHALPILSQPYYCWERRGHDRMVVGFTTTYEISNQFLCNLCTKGCRGSGRDRMVVGYAITYAISEFESCSPQTISIQHYVIKFASDLRQICGVLLVLLFHPPIKLTVMI
jgi:hypothetical protein